MMEEERFQATKKSGILGILGNLLLLVMKATVGFISNSQAMIADSVNSASDIFASLMTFVGNKIASEPKDESHNFGHGKAEYIFSLLISISMILASLKLLYDAIVSLVNQEHFIFSWSLILVCLITIITKTFLYFYTRHWNKKYPSILLESNMKDHRNDCFVTTGTLISLLFSLKGIYFLDGIVGILIALWICITGAKIFIESYNVLMDISVDEETKDDILNIIKNYQEIKKIDPIRSTPIGYQYIVSITIYVDGNLTTFESHKIADNLEKDIQKIEKISHAIIHVNPV